MMLIDTHCHVHDSEFYPDNKEHAYRQARDAGVVMICVGTDVRSSIEAVEFARTHEGCYAIVGIHPHEAKDSDVAEIRELLQHEQRRTQNRDPRTIIGIGEIGLDYFYDHSPQDIQQQVLRQQLQLAVEFALPVSFHIREAFVDFWPIFDEFPDIKGVMHSFTDTRANLKQAMKRGLLVGINGISTFTKDESQQTMFRDLPLQHILLETDAPFLTPKPFRGKMNVPAYVAVIAEHQAALKGITKEEVARVTTANAQELFGI